MGKSKRTYSEQAWFLKFVPRKSLRGYQGCFNWYESKQKGQGNRFISVIESEIEYISIHPEHSPINRDKFREVILKKFPYLLIYTFDGNEIAIPAVSNTYQNPRKRL